LFVGGTIGRNQQFRHGDGGRDRLRIGLFEPRKDAIGEGKISRIRLQVVNEDARIQCDPAVTPEKGAEAV
jgi:hypothetical protein